MRQLTATSGMSNINPAQMMNMMNGGTMNPQNLMNTNMGGSNAGMMNGMGNMGSINPAALMAGESSFARIHAVSEDSTGASSPTHQNQNFNAQFNPSTSPTAPQAQIASMGNPASPSHHNHSPQQMGFPGGQGHNAGALNATVIQNLQNLGMTPMQIAQLAQMQPADRERTLNQFRMMQMQRAAMMREQHGQQQAQQHHMQGPGANMGGGQGMGMASAQQMQMQQQAHERFQQLSQGQYEQQRPSSAASTGSHSQRLAQGQGQGQGQGMSTAQQQQQQQQFQNAQSNAMLQHQHAMSGAVPSAMMPPPTSIPPRPSTATSQRPQQPGAFPAPNVGANANANRGAPSPSPRPGTGGGPRATPSPRPPSGNLPGVGTPVPIQPRPMAGTPGPATRPGTGMSVHGADGQQKAPSRPTTATGFAQQHHQQQAQVQQGQNGNFLGMGHPNGALQTPTARSPGGFPAIAPAPAMPGSPTRGAKRRLGTPVPGQPQQLQLQPQPQPQPQQIHPPPQTPHLPMPSIANVNISAGGGGTGLTGMGIMGNVGPAGSQNAAANLGVGMGLLGGAGGGMMGPPVLPRSTSQGQIHQAHGGDMGGMGMGMNANMNINGGAFPAPGMTRQLSAGPMGVNPNFPSAPTPAAQLGLPSTTGLPASSPMHVPGLGQNGAMDTMGPSRAMGALPNGVGLGLGTSGLSGMGGIDVPIPQTPMQQHARQTSQPPISSPFPHGSSPIAGPNLSGAGLQNGLIDRKPSEGLGTAANAQDNAATKTANGASNAAPAVPPAPTVIPQLAPLPANVQLDPKVSRVSIVPLKDSATLIPPLTEDQIAEIKTYMKIDKEYEGRYKHMREKMTDELRGTVGKPHAWWEKDTTLEDGRMGMRKRQDKFSLTGQKHFKERELKERRKAGKREGFKLYVVTRPLYLNH